MFAKGQLKMKQIDRHCYFGTKLDNTLHIGRERERERENNCPSTIGKYLRRLEGNTDKACHFLQITICHSLSPCLFRSLRVTPSPHCPHLITSSPINFLLVSNSSHHSPDRTCNTGSSSPFSHFAPMPPCHHQPIPS